MKNRTLILLGAAVFVISLVLSTPAALLYANLVKAPGAVQPVGLDGTLAEGHASALLINGQQSVQNLHWRFRPLSLLLARLAFHVDGGGNGLNFDGKLARLIGGGIDIDDLRAAGPIKSLLPLFGGAFLPIAGQAGAKLDSLKLRAGFPRTARGLIQLNGLQWTLAKDPLLLGDFQGRIVTEKDVIVVHAEPVAGPLEVGGEIRLLADHSYEVDLQVKAKPTAEPLVQNLVRSLGQSDTQGFYHVRSRGQL